ncbi:MAG: osmotically inducible protein OsmC [Candidatus Aminicenantes bacterium RBG_13_63_10]|nr:MAG: osmotically inducible protein OsmC [Candidatus Aminicenantes bacterium RBG_13_63_10]
MDDIRVTFPGGLKVDVNIKNHIVHTDQPPHAGGGGEAPAPFDLFLASIASCAGFYLLAFCRERKIDTAGAGVRMSLERDPARRMISRVSLELELPPGFPEKYHQAVVRAVDTCSVKAHILTPPDFQISVKPAE